MMTHILVTLVTIFPWTTSAMAQKVRDQTQVRSEAKISGTHTCAQHRCVSRTWPFYTGSAGSVDEGAVICLRRSRLPSPSPNNSTVSLWNILRNNIGKDLSKVAMPVQLNEPLNTLQRLCEELEYSELLDRAAVTQDPFERMVRREEWFLLVELVWARRLPYSCFHVWMCELASGRCPCDGFK